MSFQLPISYKRCTEIYCFCREPLVTESTVRMRLPILDSLTVEHLSLYKSKITQRILPGVNMVIGGNGVGKTTLVKTILFALLGNTEHERLNSAGKPERVPVVDT